MPIFAIEDSAPDFADRATGWIAPGATVIGNVRVGRDVSIWFGAVLRGDNEPIVIGDRSNVQEHVIMHTDPGFPLAVGSGCTIGHRALLHGCTIGDDCLIGMGAILLNGSCIGRDSLVAAGALVTEGKEFPEGSLIVGVPAKVVRSLDTKALARIKASSAHYVANARRFAAGLAQVPLIPK
jgi:carbonic anhydrase/acetyltransferase-like protein (isoleucine patch superfamily)